MASANYNVYNMDTSDQYSNNYGHMVKRDNSRYPNEPDLSRHSTSVITTTTSNLPDDSLSSISTPISMPPSTVASIVPSTGEEETVSVEIPHAPTFASYSAETVCQTALLTH